MSLRYLSRGFSLLEMLTVLVIIAVVAQYLVSVSMQAREKAYRTTCISNLRQLVQACKMYESDYGSLPVDCWGYWNGIDFGEGHWQLLTYAYAGHRGMYICPIDPLKGFGLESGGGPPTSYRYALTCPWLGYQGEYRPPRSRSPLILDGYHSMKTGILLIARYDGSLEQAPANRYESITYEPEDGLGPLFPPPTMKP